MLFRIRKVTQISESHCGPAVLEMLLDAMGITVSQREIARAAGVTQTIEEHGTRVDQLGLACSRLAPQMQFWYKYHSTLDDIRYVLKRGFAVGVEWQGLFYDDEEDEEEDGDYGHYSIISHLDDDRQVLIIVDPYKEFVDQDRIFSVPVFLKRWWETNEIIDPATGRPRLSTDEQLLFFVTPIDEYFPEDLGFRRFSEEDLEFWYLYSR